MPNHSVTEIMEGFEFVLYEEKLEFAFEKLSRLEY